MGDRNYKISADAPVEEYMRYFGIPRNQAIELRAQRILMMERSKQLLSKNYGSNEENPETVDSERGRANGGRIGFQDGKTLDFEVYKFYFMNALGMDEEEAEKATEQELYGPDSARLRDSKKGIGSMMASMDDDSEPNAEIIEPSFDSGGEEELMREIETQGGLRTASTQDEMADAYALYDSAVEAGFNGSFEEFIQLMMIEANRGQSIKGAEGLASLRA